MALKNLWGDRSPRSDTAANSFSKAEPAQKWAVCMCVYVWVYVSLQAAVKSFVDTGITSAVVGTVPLIR